MKVYSFLILLFLHSSYADIEWPEYNQQCQDDAGSPFLDDEETYGPNGLYHDKTAAYPVLPDGECSKPLEQACKDRPTYKAAYLEGPIDCGNNGWYCRIMPDPNWEPINLTGDLNFGHCNTTDGFEDAGYDQDGHCHGSSVDNTYYWWVRDHFFRQYNGRLRCCCGWYEDTSSEPLYNRRIANRCDYRRLVTKTEDVSKCRDANEEHNLGFDDIGCDPKFKATQLNDPIPENDDMCWEIQRFGYTEEEYETPTQSPDGAPTPTAPTPTAPTPSNGPEVCEDSDIQKFKLEKDGKVIWRDCEWAATRSSNFRCNLDDAVGTTCPDTCGTCDECIDSTARLKFRYKGRKMTRDCTWVATKKTVERCEIEGIAEACRETCGLCD